MSIENLIQNVDNQIIKIRTRSLDVSFNELYDMFNNEELIITPDYQRLFRWDDGKQSRFIESLILEMPVPPIFVIETKDGIYELIDGLQRISSYLHFRGEKLNNAKNKRKEDVSPKAGGESDEELDFCEDETNLDNPLKLVGCDIINELNGLTFDELPKTLQIKIKRSFVRMEVIKKESEVSLKYHMFKRLNTGGEILSAQEIRNCTIRLLGSDAIDFIDNCSGYSDFSSVIRRIGAEKKATKYNQELVLRFFAIKNDIDNYRYPVTEYLTHFLEKMTENNEFFDYEKEKEVFEKTFHFINANFGEEIFSSRTAGGTTRTDFVLYYYDAIAISLATLIDRVLLFEDTQKIVDYINSYKVGETLRQYKTGSINSVKARIRFCTEGVRNILDGR